MAQPHEPEDRLTELEDRIRANPDSRLFPQLAEEYRRAGRYDDALHTLRTGLERQPGYVSAQVLLGRCLLESGAIQASVEELERVTGNDPTHPLAHKLLSQAQLAAGRRREAADTLERYALLHSGDRELPDLRLKVQEALAAEETPEGEIEAEAPAMAPTAGGDDLFDLGAHRAPDTPTPPAASSRVPDDDWAVATTSGGDLFDLAAPPAAPAPVGDDLLGVWEPEREPASDADDVFGELIGRSDRSRWEAGLSEGDVFGATAPPPRRPSFEPNPQPVMPELARPAPFAFEAEPTAEDAEPEVTAEARTAVEAETPARFTAESVVEVPAPTVTEADPFDLTTPTPVDAEPAPSDEPFLSTADPDPVAPSPFEPEPFESTASTASDAAPVEPVEAPAPAPTMTLGRLYRDQGHDDEARGIFQAILARDPEHAEARRALTDLDAPAEPEASTSAAPPAEAATFEPPADAVASEPPTASAEIATPAAVEPAAPPAAPLSAADLEDPEDRHLGLTDRKVRLLGRYLDRLKQGAERHVS